MQKVFLVFFGLASSVVTLVSASSCAGRVSEWLTMLDSDSDFNACTGCIPEPIPFIKTSLNQRCGSEDMFSPNGTCYPSCQSLLDDINSECTFGPTGDFDSLAAATLYNPNGRNLGNSYGECNYGFEYTQCNAAIDNFYDFMRDNKDDCLFVTECSTKCTNEIKNVLQTCDGEDFEGFTLPNNPSPEQYIAGRMYTWNATDDRNLEAIWKEAAMSEECEIAAVQLAQGFDGPENDNGNNEDDDNTAVIAGAVGGAVAVIALGAGLYMYKKRKSNAISLKVSV